MKLAVLMKLHWPFIAVLALAAAVRWSAYRHLPEWQWANYYPYFDALRDHLWEYIWFNSLKPPLTYLAQGFVVKAFSNATTGEYNVPLLMVYCMDLLAATLMYLSALRLGVNRYLAAIVVGIYSLAYLTLEHWWRGVHFDSHTLFFTALFVYCLCSSLREPRTRNLAALSCAGFLLIAQSTVNALAVPVTLVGVVVVLGRLHGWTWPIMAARFAQVVAAPALILALLIAKNYLVATVPATSNLGGTANMMIVARAVHYDVARLRKAAVDAGAPEWYLWCFDHPSPAIDPGGAPYPGWDLFAIYTGICYPWSKPGDELWQHDWHPLRHKLMELGEVGLARIVDKDINDSRERQYLFHGFNPEQSARWIGVYGNVSVRIYRHFVLTHPVPYLKAVWGFNKFFRTGAYLPEQMLAPDLSRHAELEHLGSILVPAGVAYGRLAITGFWILLAGWAYLALRTFLPSLREQTDALRLPQRSMSSPGDHVGQDIAMPAFIVLSLPAILLAAVFSSQVGGENFRYFYQITPYLFLIMMLFLDEILSRLGISDPCIRKRS